MSADAKTEVTVDESLYSRQLYVFGHEAQKRMASTNVLLVGLKGLGAEIGASLLRSVIRCVLHTLTRLLYS